MAADKYIRWELHANLKGVKLSAFSVTPEHKDKTLACWKKMHATNIIVVERDAPELPLYEVDMPGSKNGRIHATFRASSEANVRSQLERYRPDGKKKLKIWQIQLAKIEESVGV